MSERPNLLIDLARQMADEAQQVRDRLERMIGLARQIHSLAERGHVDPQSVARLSSGLETLKRNLAEVLAVIPELRTPHREATSEGTESAHAVKKILVVDDERSVVDLVKRILASRGYQVDTAGDGHTAIQMVSQRAYDLIIVDLKMPDIGGMEVYQSIKEANPAQAERVAFFSGDVISPHTTSFLERAGRPFLVKPFTVQELVEFVHRALT